MGRCAFTPFASLLLSASTSGIAEYQHAASISPADIGDCELEFSAFSRAEFRSLVEECRADLHEAAGEPVETGCIQRP